MGRELRISHATLSTSASATISPGNERRGTTREITSQRGAVALIVAEARCFGHCRDAAIMSRVDHLCAQGHAEQHISCVNTRTAIDVTDSLSQQGQKQGVGELPDNQHPGQRRTMDGVQEVRLDTESATQQLRQLDHATLKGGQHQQRANNMVPTSVP